MQQLGEALVENALPYVAIPQFPEVRERHCPPISSIYRPAGTARSNNRMYLSAAAVQR